MRSHGTEEVKYIKKYRVFVSTAKDVKSLLDFKKKADALDIKYYTPFMEIEAKSEWEAGEIFSNNYSYLIDELIHSNSYSFYLVDKFGEIKPLCFE